MSVSEETWISRAPVWARLAAVLVLLTLFLVAIKLMGGSFKLVGKETARALFEGVRNPFAGVAVGVLATVLVQSSSVTTSIIVGLVGAGELSIGAAVPMVMGANIGTSITNTIVSLGHVTRSAEFRRAFAGATIHDFFNLMAVALLLPLEMATGLLQRTAAWIASGLSLGGVEFESPVKAIVGDIAKVIQGIVTDGLGLAGWGAAIVLVLIALGLIVVSLMYITRIMRSLMAARVERALNRVLAKSGLIGMTVGVLITVAVQSSSITTSLLVPLIGAGIITLEVAFPITLGANIGTTITALLAVLAAERTGAALTIALVHLLFNVTGILLIYPVPAIRRIPLRLATGLAHRAVQNRLWVVVYIGLVFVVIPLLGILFFK